jgi:GNAT superfamily N-acetyltransferase
VTSSGVPDRVPRTPSLRLRPAEAADEPFIGALFKTAKAEQFAGAGLPQAVLDALLEQQFRAQTSGYAAQFPAATSLIILERDHTVGRLLLHREARCWHIIDIVLLPSVRGRGIGTDVIRMVESAAIRDAVHGLTLVVLASNAAARWLYARLGFIETGSAAGAVHITMQKDLVNCRGAAGVDDGST